MAAKRDLVVIGGGVGGLVVASVASQLGLAVTLIEVEERLGGDCLHYGCVPSKALIQAGRIAHLMRRGGDFGLSCDGPDPVDLAAVRRHVQGTIEQLQVHDDPDRFRSYGCEVLFGAATFTGPDTVQVGDETRRGRRLVLATGSSPFIPPVPGLAEAGYLTNREVFELERLPERLAVVGGGPIGVELAQAFARLGSRVTVLQRADRLIPREDPEASTLLQEAFAREGIEVLLEADVQRAERREGGRVLHYTGPAGDASLEADEVLVSIGRRPNVEGLGLEAAGVEYGRSGVRVDDRLRTTNPRVYACGDVAGPYQFTHMAEYQAGVVIANTAFRIPKKVDYRVVPWVTYTDPEVARVGLTLDEAREQGIPAKELRFPMADVDRAVVERETAGTAKVVVRTGSRFRGGGRILGATLVGTHAGELLHEVVLAMQTGARIGAISGAIHAYPTRAQVLRRVVNTHFGEKLFSPGSRRLAQLLNRLIP